LLSQGIGFLYLLLTILCGNKPGYARKQKITKAYKARNTEKNLEMRGYATMIRILFICHGRALGTVISGDEVR
jgi:hypothetical protein